jgi:P27 family predicted phage terminase small subunit
MGERGPLPLPYARRRNHRQTSGKSVTVGRPALPRDLPEEAKAEWRRIVPVLEQAELLTAIDRGVLVRYCCAWADWVELQRLVQQSGKVLKGPRGHLVRNPLWFQLQDAGATLSELGRQLGLSPVARIRAGVAHVLPEDPEEEDSRHSHALLEYRKAAGRGPEGVMNGHEYPADHHHRTGAT